ncbi:MAG: hypothetical protein Q9170_001027 [Blastenia crenularia]
MADDTLRVWTHMILCMLAGLLLTLNSSILTIIMQYQALTQKRKAVLFGLDNTLFDHYHSLRYAMSAIPKEYAMLKGHRLEDLIAEYNVALQRSYHRYLSKKILFEETHAIKVRSFSTDLGLAEPSLDEVDDFRAVYKPAYRSNRRGTLGSIETLVRRREYGYFLAIVPNGQMEDQAAKAEAFGIRRLVDRIFTSEETGCCKPDPRIFQFAVGALGTSPDMMHMVGRFCRS